MKLLAVAIWILCSSVLPLQAAASAQPTITLYGRKYLDLAVWAKANSLRFDWDRHSRDIHVADRATSLTFTINSCEMEFNGISVWLSVPVTPSNGRILISSLDVKSAVDPLLHPVRNRRGAKVRIIALDPGHGGRQPGNEDGAHQEKVYTLLLATKVRSLLQAAGFRVVMTRTRDEFVDLPDRPAYAKRKHADLFISLHFNSAGNGESDPKGVEVYCLTPPGASSTNARGKDNGPTNAQVGNLNNAHNVLLAYRLQKALVQNLGVKDRGVRRARFAVLKTAKMPAVLIEGGFMSAPTEARQIYDATHRARMARAIVDGVLAYKRLVER